MYEPQASPIFISYSRQDSAYVEKLVAAFEDRGLSVWLDNRIDYGTAWQHEIEKHLELCKAFVLVMTPQANESHWVKCELSFALELKKPMFPLLLEGRRWFSVAAIQTVDVTDGALPSKRFFDAVSASVINMEMPLEAKSSNVASTVSISRNEVNLGFVEDEVEAALVTLQRLLTRKAQKISQLVEKPLSVDARYADLERYLKNGQWEEADDETHRLMINMVGRREGEFFSPKDLLNFPCEPLETIDRLWVRYSNGRFGFSVQRDMYVKCGGLLDGEYDNEAYEKFCNSNGWKEDGGWGEMTFNTESPKGHLPIKMDLIRRRNQRITYLFNRIQTCKL